MTIQVFIVDDSAVVRKVLSDFLDSVPGIDVIGVAQDPIFAQKKMQKTWPDVIILDVEMPRMDGITFLKQIMAERPTPVVMCSTLTEAGSRVSLQALSLGAIDVVAKPKISLDCSMEEASVELVAAVRTAAKANMAAAKPKAFVPIPRTPQKLTADAMLPKNTSGAISSTPLIAIGASTGGTQALEAVLTALPANTLPILIVQHMPEKFTKAFADRLNSLCQLTVKEAEDGDAVISGRVLLAPGGKHMMLHVNRAGVSVQVKDGPQVSRHKPSVNVLFRSVAKYAGSKALGVILTGMGDDGARGMKEMHNVNAKTIAQDSETCVVYGMPKEAVKLGAVDYEVPLSQVPKFIVSHK
ncbi:MAG: chemotaxis response regulator protein-glutamate methylesterase [Alteromonadaceae bacterium]|nr:MAG: chemotaxis response regulator protein-glutamate methylesterase [Alteromonadaceae bacterium]